MIFTVDPNAGAVIVPLSEEEIASLSPEQQAALQPVSKKGISPLIIAGAVAAAALLF